MIRKAAVAIALLLLTVSYRLSALGLGEIDMQSALNQPMKADIILNSAAGVDIEGIKVMLGSREAHERLGLSRAKILSNFKFDLVKDGRGSPVINISSTESVREPYLEFLLELVWDNGRIVREYTILVDPPVTMPAKPVAPLAPVVQAQAVAPPRVEPVALPAPAPRPPATTFSPSPVEQRVADSYGPVRREEALWSISDRLRPDSDISIQQMMIALLRANPQAFPDNNINNLKTGSTLTIPDRDAILALTAGQARAEAGRQYNEWLEKRDVASAAAQDMAVVEESVADMPVEATVVVAESDAQLKLTPPEGDPVAGAAISSGVGDSTGEPARDDKIRQQLALALEEVEAGKAHSSELQSRVLELEATIERMDRLLKLKSDPLASLQNNAGIQTDEPLPDVEIAAEDEDVEIGEIEMPAGETEQLALATGEDEIVVDTEAGDITEEVDITEEADTITADMEIAEDEFATDAESPVIEADGIVKRLMDNPVLAGLGVLVAMLLGGFLWGSRRKHSDEDMFDAESDDERFTEASENASGSGGRVTSVSDPGTYDEGVEESMEVSSSDAANDPITEADVYLAYGRVHQAEDVLQEALREDPNNITVRAKLLDVFHAAGNVAAFNNAAGEYRELAPEDNEEWSRIAVMGLELAPGNELYSAAKQVSGGAGNSIDFDMDLSGMDDMSSAAAITDDAADLALSMDAETAEVDEVPEVLEFTLDDTNEDELDGEGLLASTDEVATKLDLARAYLDMEDPEGARSILQEVLEEGSTEQKSEAESLISKIV